MKQRIEIYLDIFLFPRRYEKQTQHRVNNITSKVPMCMRVYIYFFF